MPEIVPFTAAHLPEAGRIALRFWGEEVPSIPVALRGFLYDSLAKYYFVPDSPCNLAAVEAGALTAFLLAAPSGAARRFTPPFPAGKERPEPERSILCEYKAYLDSNRHAEHGVMQENEIVMLFFASTRKGHGKLLLSALEQYAMQSRYDSLLLWTDETCDFGYYAKHGFREIARFPCGAPLGGRCFDTYLFRKTLF